MAACSWGRPPRSWARPRRRSCGRSWPRRTDRCGPAAATKARCSRCEGRQGHHVLRCHGARGARHRAGAAGRPVCGHVPRREDLFGRSRRLLENAVRSRRQIHLGPGLRSVRHALRRHRRQGGHLQDHARRQGQRFYKTSATNVVSLAVTKSGELIAGTESPGRVFRIDATGKAFVLLDSPYREIHALGSLPTAPSTRRRERDDPSGGSDRPSEPRQSMPAVRSSRRSRPRSRR